MTSRLELVSICNLNPSCSKCLQNHPSFVSLVVVQLVTVVFSLKCFYLEEKWFNFWVTFINLNIMFYYVIYSLRMITQVVCVHLINLLTPAVSSPHATTSFNNSINLIVH